MVRFMSYKNLSPGAPWRSTLLSFEGYKRSALNESPWAAFRGFHNQVVHRIGLSPVVSRL
eukprot:13312059-Alexandrium_andersonii.AAC.1